MNADALISTGVDKHWYVVYTRPRWEKKVVELLTRAGIENYCPLNKITRKWSDREKVVLEPIFKSYVFVRVSESQKWLVTEVAGVLNYIYWLGKPAVVPGAEIEQIKSFLNNYDEVFLQSVNLKPGDKIKVTKGVFVNLEGNVIALNGKQVQIYIPSLRIALVAIATDNVAVISA
jgi:transcription antitermination factor NusG